MDPEFTEDEVLLKETVRRFAQEVLAPRAAELDETAAFPAEHLPKLAELGLMGMNLPERWGGPGISAPGLMLAVEEIAGACAATASMVTAHFLASDAVLLGGSDDLRQRYLPAAAAGNTLGAFGLTEPGAGSNPADMRTTARRDGAGYRLEGVKHFISNGGLADFVVVFALSDPAAGHRGISAFVVDKGTEGFVAGPPQPTMGLRAGQIFELSFDCLVPEKNRIGPEGSGFKTALRVLDNGRVEVAAMCLGIAQAAFDAALAWAKQRDLGEAARSVGPAAGRAPGHTVDAGRHGDPTGRGPAARAARGAAAPGWPALHQGGRHGQALRLGDGRQGERFGAAGPRRLRLLPRPAA
jgi:butyryl-CoA dehydrogenase